MREAEFNKSFTEKWVVKEDDYASDYYPTYNQGPFYFLSADIVQMIPDHCTMHCLPQTNKKSKTTSCFWRFEDAFIGSCISKFAPDVKTLNISGNFQDVNAEPLSLKVGDWTAVLHPLKNTSDLVDVHAGFQMLPRNRIMAKIDELNEKLTFKVQEAVRKRK